MPHPHDLILGALAVRSGALDSRQLDQVLGEIDGGTRRELVERLERRGWLTPEQGARLERELSEHLMRHGDDADATLAEMRQSGLHAPLEETEVATLAGAEGRTSGPLAARLGPGGADPTIQQPPCPGDDTDTDADADATLPSNQATLPSKPAHDDDTASSAIAREVTVTSDPGLVLIGALDAPPESATTRYSFSHVHASGGVGQVWLARDTAMGRDVAVKELKSDHQHSHSTWARFVDEARITGQLEHPGIVPVYELGTRPDDRNPFYTMRFIRGRTLSQSIRAYYQGVKEGNADPLALHGLITAFVSICKTVAYAHSRGVIHRDLKSQNVVQGDYGEVMVLDWGLAKLLGQAAGSKADADDLESSGFQLARNLHHDETVAGQIMGTPAYMSPEQAEGAIDTMDARTDVYGLGAILYEILTGQPPIERAGIHEMLRRVKEEAPVPPRQRNAAAPPALAAVCLKALQKRPSDRYPSAQALADDVGRWLADEPVAAYPEPWPQRLGRWARKHRQLVAAASILLGLSLAGLTLGYLLVRRERDEANHQRLLASVQREVARQAVNDMYTDVAELWLEDNLDTTQNTFLERALAYYETFAGQKDATPEIALERARALRRVAEIQRKLGQTEAAGQTFANALAVLASLKPADAQRPAARLERGLIESRQASLEGLLNHYEAASALEDQALATLEPVAQQESGSRAEAALVELARVHRLRAERLRNERRNDASLASYRTALETLEKTLGPDPRPLEARKELARILEGIGLLQSELRAFDDARPALERAIQLQQSLVDQFPTIPRFRIDLATTSDTLGRLMIDTGETGAAESLLNRAIGHYQRLASDFPDRLEYRRTLSRGRVNLGLLLQARGDYQAAEDRYRGAIDELAELVKLDSTMPKFQRDLGIAWQNLAGVFTLLGEAQKSEHAYAQSVAILEALANRNSATPDYGLYLSNALSSWALTLDALGQYEAAEKAYRQAINRLQKLVVAYPEDHEYQESLARGQASLGQVLARTNRAEPAVSAYREAISRYEALNSPEPRTSTARGGLAAALSNLAEVPELLGKGEPVPSLPLSEREALARRALALAQLDLDQHGDSPPARAAVAGILTNLGEILAEGDAANRAEAVSLFERAELEFALLATTTEMGGSLELRRDVAQARLSHGRLLLQQGQPAAAQSVLEQGLVDAKAALAGDRPDEAHELVADTVAQLGQSLLDQGQFARAAELATDLGRSLPTDAMARVAAARLLSQGVARADADASLPSERKTPLTRSLGDRAVAQLRVAAESGLPVFDQIQADAAFDPIRGRDDFKALLADVRTQAVEDTGIPVAP